MASKKRLTLLMASILALASNANAENISRVKDEKRHITVSANADIRVKPDKVSLTFGVKDRSKNLREAKERMTHVIKEAIAYCKANGVQEKNIQINTIDIKPDYDYSRSDERIVLQYYELTQSVNITIGEVGKYNDIILGLLDKGINTIENINFSTSDLRKHRDAARLAAIKAAQEKAKLLTDAVGIKLGKVVGIQEGREGVSYYSRSRSGASQSQNVMQSWSGGEDSEGGAPGAISVSAGVSITYELDLPQ